MLAEIEEDNRINDNMRYETRPEEAQGADEDRRRGLAERKVKADCARTAAQLLRGQGMLPAREATAEAQAQQLVCDRTSSEQIAFDEAMTLAWEAGLESKIQIKEWCIRRRLDCLRVGAQPGGSGFRNDVVIAMSEVKTGVMCLQRWAQCWAEGRVPPVIVGILGAQVLRPIRKENGKPRNISLMECLVKFASGVVQETVRQGRVAGDGSSCEGLHWSQYGSQPAGPELMLMVHQGLMNLRPNLAYVSLDGENAFGAMRRAVMLQGAARFCPAHSCFLACLWSGPTRGFIEAGERTWKEVNIKEGTAQGDTSSNPAFSRGHPLVLERAWERMHERGLWVHLPSLVDDILVVMAPENVDSAVAIVSEEMGKAGLRLNLSKSAAYIPARSIAAQGPDEQITSVPQVDGGLPALGCAYAGEFEAILGPYAVAAEPARRRLEKAVALAKECARYSSEGRSESSWQAAWYLLRRVAAKALTYDVRTLEHSVSVPIAEQLDKAVNWAAK